MKVYISGKIGEEVISEATRQKFARVEEMLKGKGFEVFNPTDEHWEAHLKKRYELDRKVYQPYTDGHMPDFYTYCLLRDLMALSTKDAIYMLPDFIDSKGAKAEHAFAIATCKRVYYDEELFRDGTLRGRGYEKNYLPETAI
jgi:hypothetical protein